MGGNEQYTGGRNLQYGANLETLTSTAPVIDPDITVSLIDSTSNAVDGTLADGTEEGQIKMIVMIEASNSSTVTVAKHLTSDPEVFTFDAVEEMLIMVWGGGQWNTIHKTATV